jgi:hypothetical protein
MTHESLEQAIFLIAAMVHEISSHVSMYDRDGICCASELIPPCHAQCNGVCGIKAHVFVYQPDCFASLMECAHKVFVYFGLFVCDWACHRFRSCWPSEHYGMRLEPAGTFLDR